MAEANLPGDDRMRRMAEGRRQRYAPDEIPDAFVTGATHMGVNAPRGIPAEPVGDPGAATAGENFPPTPPRRAESRIDDAATRFANVATPAEDPADPQPQRNGRGPLGWFRQPRPITDPDTPLPPAGPIPPTPDAGGAAAAPTTPERRVVLGERTRHALEMLNAGKWEIGAIAFGAAGRVLATKLGLPPEAMGDILKAVGAGSALLSSFTTVLEMRIAQERNSLPLSEIDTRIDLSHHQRFVAIARRVVVGATLASAAAAVSGLVSENGINGLLNQISQSGGSAPETPTAVATATATHTPEPSHRPAGVGTPEPSQPPAGVGTPEPTPTHGSTHTPEPSNPPAGVGTTEPAASTSPATATPDVPKPTATLPIVPTHPPTVTPTPVPTPDTGSHVLPTDPNTNPSIVPPASTPPINPPLIDNPPGDGGTPQNGGHPWEWKPDPGNGSPVIPDQGGWQPNPELHIGLIDNIESPSGHTINGILGDPDNPLTFDGKEWHLLGREEEVYKLLETNGIQMDRDEFHKAYRDFMQDAANDWANGKLDDDSAKGALLHHANYTGSKQAELTEEVIIDKFKHALDIYKAETPPIVPGTQTPPTTTIVPPNPNRIDVNGFGSEDAPPGYKPAEIIPSEATPLDITSTYGHHVTGTVGTDLMIDDKSWALAENGEKNLHIVFQQAGVPDNFTLNHDNYNAYLEHGIKLWANNELTLESHPLEYVAFHGANGTASEWQYILDHAPEIVKEYQAHPEFFEPQIVNQNSQFPDELGIPPAQGANVTAPVEGVFTPSPDVDKSIHFEAIDHITSPSGHEINGQLGNPDNPLTFGKEIWNLDDPGKEAQLFTLASENGLQVDQGTFHTALTHTLQDTAFLYAKGELDDYSPKGLVFHWFNGTISMQPYFEQNPSAFREAFQQVIQQHPELLVPQTPEPAPNVIPFPGRSNNIVPFPIPADRQAA